MNRMIFFASWCSCLFFFSGCGEKFPPDFPKVYPITVTVKNGETPLPNIQVTFIPADKGTTNVSYSASGATKENGVAAISTIQGSFVKKGIPVGEFIVTVADLFVFQSSDVSAEEKLNMSREELFQLAQEEQKRMAEFVKMVPEVLCKPMAASDAESSPIRFTATKGKNELVIDIAEYK